jgi:hypothetical protein
MARTFNTTHAAAWAKMGIGQRERPGQNIPGYTTRDLQALKNEYNAQYGYTIRIPQWDDVVHLTPDAFKTKEQIKAEKKEALVRVLDSPAPEWYRSVSTVMTWIDDIQDTSSVVYPLLKGLAIIAPKAFAKAASVIGWITGVYDVLNFLTAMGTAPLAPMTGKRELCKMYKNNPFTKQSRLSRLHHIKNWKPNWADALQAAQVSDNLFGFGLSLGGIMGAATDMLFGAYRYAKGDPVKISFDKPVIENLQHMGGKGLKAAAAISSQGQVFSEMQHFWTYVTAALSSQALAGWYQENDVSDMIDDVPNVILEAPRPTNQLTLEVLQEAKIDIEKTTQWPWTDKKEITVSDFLEATAEPIRSNFFDYCRRHDHDSYGFVAAQAMDHLLPQTFCAIDPEIDLVQDDTPFMKTYWKMAKAPILPKRMMDPQQLRQFGQWTEVYYREYDRAPSIGEIEQKLIDLGVPFEQAYPPAETADFQKYFLPGWRGED